MKFLFCEFNNNFIKNIDRNNFFNNLAYNLFILKRLIILENKLCAQKESNPQPSEPESDVLSS